MFQSFLLNSVLFQNLFAPEPIRNPITHRAQSEIMQRRQQQPDCVWASRVSIGPATSTLSSSANGDDEVEQAQAVKVPVEIEVETEAECEESSSSPSSAQVCV